MIQTEYLAGLWKSQLPHTLLWAVKPGQPCQKRLSGIAPSWSWASISGSVEYPEHFEASKDEGHYNQTLIEILEAKVTLTDEANQFGAVKNGFLRVRGKLGWAEWGGECSNRNTAFDIPGWITNEATCSSTVTRVASVKEFDILGGDGDSISVYLDDVAECADGAGYFLPVEIHDGDEQAEIASSVEALIFWEQDDGSFVRIGKISIWRTDIKDILECLPEVELTIK